MNNKRKYRCPFCDKSFERVKLADHIEKLHSEMLNEDGEYTANRIVFDICNKKDPIGSGFGICRICKKHTKWDEDNVHYDAYCSDACKAEAREQYKKNMLRVRGTYNLLADTDWQEKKMLANRGISGKYKWSDGTYKTFVGSYEKKFLEFCDDVLHIKSDDLMTPGPTIEYEYNGQKHTWITDAIYLPYNLVFDIKDGGDNKNKREMPEYRAKQVNKEKFITDQGVYNYIRLTNNEFVQLLTIFAELKSMYIEDPDKVTTISRIHEHMGGAAIGGLPPAGATDTNPNVFITNYMNKNTYNKKSGFVLSNDILSDYVLDVDDEGNIIKVKSKDKLDENTICNIYKYLGDPSPILREVYHKYNNHIKVSQDYFTKLVTEFDDILSEDQLQFSNLLEEVNLDQINEQFHTNIESLKFQLNMINETPKVFPVLDPVKYEYKKKLLEGYDNITILQSMDHKYFALNNVTMKRTRSVDSIYDIKESLLCTIR